MSDKVRVLHILSSLRSGGVAVLLYNYFMKMDKSKISFDFIVHVQDKGFIEKKLDSFDVRVFHLPRFNHIWSTFFKTRKIIKEGKYQIVHVHHTSKSFIQLFAAWTCGVPVRIAHSHEYINKKFPLSIVYRFYGFLTTSFASDFFACSDMAAKCVFGTKETLKMYNAIDASQFKFDRQMREKYRRELDLNSKFVLIHVGRFTEPKNHVRLIEIFQKIHERNFNSILLLVGTGELLSDVKKIVEQKRMKSSVLFLGERSDVPHLLCASDMFLFPSLHEGLGIVLIEAQSTGMKCVTSKNVVPQEVDLFGNVSFISLEDDDEHWAEEIIKNSVYERMDYSLELKRCNYDLAHESTKLEKWYLNKVE